MENFERNIIQASLLHEREDNWVDKALSFHRLYKNFGVVAVRRFVSENVDVKMNIHKIQNVVKRPYFTSFKIITDIGNMDFEIDFKEDVFSAWIFSKNSQLLVARLILK